MARKSVTSFGTSSLLFQPANKHTQALHMFCVTPFSEKLFLQHRRELHVPITRNKAAFTPCLQERPHPCTSNNVINLQKVVLLLLFPVPISSSCLSGALSAPVASVLSWQASAGSVRQVLRTGIQYSMASPHFPCDEEHGTLLTNITVKSAGSEDTPWAPEPNQLAFLRKLQPTSVCNRHTPSEEYRIEWDMEANGAQKHGATREKGLKANSKCTRERKCQ